MSRLAEASSDKPDPTSPSSGSSSSPPAVSRFEYNLLRLLRFLLGHAPTDQAVPLLNAKLPAPPCLSPVCVKLVRETIAKGVVLHLVRAGGWRKQKFLRKNEPKDGRGWERTPLEERKLAFSPHPVELLIWLTSEKLSETKDPGPTPKQELTVADEIFFALAFENLRGIADVLPVVQKFPCFRRNPLCWLTFPGDVAYPEGKAPGFERYVTGLGAVVMECLQPHLAHRWTRSEREKGQIADWKKMRLQGTAEYDALSGFLAAAGKANRPDLARFLLRTAGAILANRPDLTPEFWTGGLKDSRPQRLADRLETTRAALALPRQMETLRGWDRKARTVGYFDEDYQASQLWKADWEAGHGDEVANRAHEVLEQLEPLRTS